MSAEELEGFSEFLKKFSTRRNNREISPGQIQKTDGAQSSSVKVSNSQITRAQILPAIEYCNSKSKGNFLFSDSLQFVISLLSYIL